jgi:hypothetical protein
VSNNIENLKQLVLRLEQDYEISLQSEGDTQVAYKEGVIAGVKLAIKSLRSNLLYFYIPPI